MDRGSKIEVHTVLKLIADAMTAIEAFVRTQGRQVDLVDVQ